MVLHRTNRPHCGRRHCGEPARLDHSPRQVYRPPPGHVSGTSHRRWGVRRRLTRRPHIAALGDSRSRGRAFAWPSAPRASPAVGVVLSSSNGHADQCPGRLHPMRGLPLHPVVSHRCVSSSGSSSAPISRAVLGGRGGWRWQVIARRNTQMARSLPSFDSTDVATGRLVVTLTPVNGVYMPSSPNCFRRACFACHASRSACWSASTAASVRAGVRSPGSSHRRGPTACPRKHSFVCRR